MDENISLIKTKRQTINPLVDIINQDIEPVLKKAANEFGYKIPLVFALYNQIRFYEEYGKLNIGVSVASKETLAEQFGVDVKKIDTAFDNLTNRYKLGKWVTHDQPIFRNVTRTWVSNERLNSGQKYYSVIPKVLQRNTKSITAEYLALDEPLLSENKKKVRENIEDGFIEPKKEDTMNVEVNGIIKLRRELGWSTPLAGVKGERKIVSTLLKRIKYRELYDNMKKYEKYRSEKFMPQANDLYEFNHKYPSIKAQLDQFNEWT